MSRLIQITAVASCLLLMGCEKAGFLGPDITELYGNFEVLADFGHDKPSGVDFASGESVGFVGEFSINANWTITVTGLSSGAVREINGFGSKLDGNASWDGRSDGVFFRTEQCSAVLTFDSFDESFADTVSVNSVFDYSNAGVLLADFESTAGYSAVAGSDTKDKDRVNDGTAPEGDYHFRLTGDEPGGAYWLGALRMTGLDGTLPDRDPEDVYFNAFFNGLGLSGTKAQVRMEEDEDGDGQVDEKWKFEIILDGTGWEKVSLPMSDAVLDGGFSNNIVEPSKVTKIDITLSTNGAGAATSPSHGYEIDYIIFTEDSAL